MNMEKNMEIQQEQEEFTGDASQVAALAAQESALVPYIPKSNAPFKMDTLIPRNMAFEVQKALNSIVKEKGNIDGYVRNGLKYVSKATLWKALAAEQVDALALYLKQFERGQGIIVADQTGIGKGRQAAAVIRHAVKNGYLPIFFTKIQISIPLLSIQIPKEKLKMLMVVWCSLHYLQMLSKPYYLRKIPMT